MLRRSKAVTATSRPVEHGPPPETRAVESLVNLRELTVGYEGVVALEDVSLDLRRGEFLGVVGPSGSGKTTLLRAIMGQADRFAGELTCLPPEGRKALRFGYVPQVGTIDWNFPITVEQVVLLGRWRESGRLPWPRRQDRALVGQVLERLGIGNLGGRHIRALSGGEQQRTFLARALIGDPDLLLLDEPTSGVDTKTRHDIMHLLGELNRAGVGIILTTHELNGVAAHLRRLVCVADRTVIADGTPAEVFTPEILRRTYGAEMMVIRRGNAIYVLEHPDGEDLVTEPEVVPAGSAEAGGSRWAP